MPSVYRVRGPFPSPWPYRFRRPRRPSTVPDLIVEPTVDSRVSGVMEITGERVEGRYLGSLCWSRSLNRPALANLHVDDPRRVVAVTYDSLERL